MRTRAGTGGSAIEVRPILAGLRPTVTRGNRSERTTSSGAGAGARFGPGAGSLEQRLDFRRFERLLGQELLGQRAERLAVGDDDVARSIVAAHHHLADRIVHALCCRLADGVRAIGLEAVTR